MNGVTYKVTDARLGRDRALMFFNLAIGWTDESGEFHGQFQVRDFILKQKNDGTGYYYSAPSKVRKKGGEVVKDDKGYDVYDDIFDLYFTVGGNPKEPTKRSAPSEAWEARKDIIEQAVTVYKDLVAAQSGRGVTTTKTGEAQNYAKSTGGVRRSAPLALASNDDDEIPF
jgi:hypothetical protein